MADEFVSIKLPFPDDASVRDLLNRPEVAAAGLKQVAAIVVSSRRLSAVMQYLHKPTAKPSTPPNVPGGAILRGMVFGHVAVYTSRDVENDQALLFLLLQAAPAAQDPAAQAGAPAGAPAPSPRKQQVRMVGMPSQRPLSPPQPAAPPQAPMERPISEDIKFFSGPSSVARQPSREKLKRWTEIIPSGTRIRRPNYPDAEDHPRRPETAAETPPHSSPEETAVRLPVEAPPPELRSDDRIVLAKEAARVIGDVMGILDKAERIPYDQRCDLNAEMRMLQLELDKFRPGIVRITEMLMTISAVPEVQPQVARLKECLRGLGLLL